MKKNSQNDSQSSGDSANLSGSQNIQMADPQDLNQNSQSAADNQGNTSQAQALVPVPIPATQIEEEKRSSQQMQSEPNSWRLSEAGLGLASVSSVANS